MSNYDRMDTRACFRFTPSIHPAICNVCMDLYWDHSHRQGDTARSWVLISDSERERMKFRWGEQMEKRRNRRVR